MKKLNINALDIEIAACIKDFQQDNSREVQGEELTLFNALQQYLTWEGVVGYTHDIMSIVDAYRPESAVIPDHYTELLEAMQEHGGSFASALAKAWQYADLENQQKLLLAFKPLLETYKQFLPMTPGRRAPCGCVEGGENCPDHGGPQ